MNGIQLKKLAPKEITTPKRKRLQMWIWHQRRWLMPLRLKFYHPSVNFCKKRSTVKGRKLVCISRHADYATGYKPEEVKRYCKVGGEHFGLQCQGFFKIIADERFKSCLVPSLISPVHICFGRNNFHCRTVFAIHVS